MSRLSRIIMTLLLFISSVFAQGEIKDIYKASNDAKMNHKPIIFVVLSSKCPHCIAYWNNTLSRPEILTLLGKEFEYAVSVIDKGGKVPSNLPFGGKTPTTYFLDSSSEMMINPVEGNIPPSEMYEFLMKITKAKYKGRIE